MPKNCSVCKFKGEILWDTSKPDGTPRKKVDTSKINNLGWQPKTKLDEGLKNTLEHYKKELNERIVREKLNLTIADLYEILKISHLILC